MPAIILSNCSICLKDYKGPLSQEERERLADPDCPQCQGWGYYESKEDMMKRSVEQRACDDVLDKVDAMEDVGLDWEKMSDEEFEEWTPDTDSSHLIKKSEHLQKSKALEAEKRNIEFAKMEDRNKIARRKLRQIRRNLNYFEK